MENSASQIKNIKEVTEPLKEQILKGDVHTVDEMWAWLKPLGYSDTIKKNYAKHFPRNRSASF